MSRKGDPNILKLKYVRRFNFVCRYLRSKNRKVNIKMCPGFSLDTRMIGF